MLTVVESALFARLWPDYWSPEEYADFIVFLAANPDAGDVVAGTGGCRKVRAADDLLEIRARHDRGGCAATYFGGTAQMKKQTTALRVRDSARDIGAELLEAIRDVKAGRTGARFIVEANEIAQTRLRTGLSQADFAAALQISARTLQQWEQGRRQPSGAAETLLRIVARHPDVLREVVADQRSGTKARLPPRR